MLSRFFPRMLHPNTLAFFPTLITRLPDARVPIKGVDSFVFQGENQQAVFMSFHKKVVVPLHSHEEQMGTILKGRLELSVHYDPENPKITVYHKGDTYHIPQGVMHAATIYPDQDGYMDLTVFNTPQRYHNDLPIPTAPELVKTPPLSHFTSANFFPKFITKLPDACVGLGSDAFLLQGITQQLVFMAFHDKVLLQPHSHAAQVGIILKGALSLTVHSKINPPETNIYQAGDIYSVPAGITHSAIIMPTKDGYIDVTIFDQPNRYGKFNKKIDIPSETSMLGPKRG